MERIIKNMLLYGLGYFIMTMVGNMKDVTLTNQQMLFCAAFPIGLLFTGKYFGHVSLSGGLFAIILNLVLKVVIGAVIGWCVLAVNVFIGVFEILSSIVKWIWRRCHRYPRYRGSYLRY